MNLMRIAVIASSLAFWGGLPEASASIIVQTVTIGGASGGGSHQAVIGPIAAFDGSLGTLSSVTASLAGSLFVPESANPGFSFPLTLLYDMKVTTSGYQGNVLVEDSGSSQSYPTTPISGSGSSSSPTDFLGSGGIQLYFSQTESVVNGTAGAPLFTGQLAVTYTYDPALEPSSVPEPSAFSLMGAALAVLGGLGLAGRGPVRRAARPVRP